ncbi:hypothetical protein CLV89_11965 [Tritonibacter scottomollicae]|uniref:Uncharacterized protein n=1 Tax=Tritonibacter scottomollicae TaxID=483013 RepID=A0A2T1A8L9_TRISK|nr:hypothetical protein CLV89_11965 [Tritonibacter scottomollicae]
MQSRTGDAPSMMNTRGGKKTFAAISMDVRYQPLMFRHYLKPLLAPRINMMAFIGPDCQTV